MPLTLIVYAVAFLAAVGAVWGFVHEHDNTVRAAEAALWKPKLEAVQQNELTLKNVNAQLQLDFTGLDTKYKEQGTQVDALKTASDAAMARAKVALAASVAKDKELTKVRATQDSVLAAPAETDRTKDYDQAKSILDDYVARSLRDN